MGNVLKSRVDGEGQKQEEAEGQEEEKVRWKRKRINFGALLYTVKTNFACFDVTL